MKKKILITGSGRCGTHAIAQFLNGMEFKSGEKVAACHETNRKYFLESLRDKNWSNIENFFYNLKHHIEVSPYISLLPEKPNKNTIIIAIIRNGRDTVKSGMNSGWFLDLPQSDAPWKDYLPEFNGDRFEKCCQLWAWVYEKLECWDSKFFKLEDLINNMDTRNEFFAALDIISGPKLFLSSNFATSRKKYVLDMGNKELLDWDQWTPKQQEIFTKHCGKIMNKYYPDANLQ